MFDLHWISLRERRGTTVSLPPVNRTDYRRSRDYDLRPGLIWRFTERGGVINDVPVLFIEILWPRSA